MTPRIPRTLTVLGVLALLAAGCSSGAGTATDGASATVGTSASTWTPITVTTADAGRTIPIVPDQVVVIDVETEPGIDLFVTSSDEGVARVEQAEGTGAVTAAPAVYGVTAGSATITVQGIDDSKDAAPADLLSFTLKVQAAAQPQRNAAGIEAAMTGCPTELTKDPNSAAAVAGQFGPTAPRNVSALHLGAVWYEITWERPESTGPYPLKSYVLIIANDRSGTQTSYAQPIPRDEPLRENGFMDLQIWPPTDPHRVKVLACDEQGGGAESPWVDVPLPDAGASG